MVEKCRDWIQFNGIRHTTLTTDKTIASNLNSRTHAQTQHVMQPMANATFRITKVMPELVTESKHSITPSLSRSTDRRYTREDFSYAFIALSKAGYFLLSHKFQAKKVILQWNSSRAAGKSNPDISAVARQKKKNKTAEIYLSFNAYVSISCWNGIDYTCYTLKLYLHDKDTHQTQWNYLFGWTPTCCWINPNNPRGYKQCCQRSILGV